MLPAEALAALVLLGIAAAAVIRRQALPEAGQQGAGLFAGLSFSNMVEETARAVSTAAYPHADRNIAAFLAMIRRAEGTDRHADPYRVAFGGVIFESLADHPRRAVQFTDKAGRRLWTSAAGAYQFMAVAPLPDGSGRRTRLDTWDRLAAKLGLADFGPGSQDRAAIELIDEAGALDDVKAGRFDAAVSKVRRVWASLPGAGYAQPEKSLAAVRDAFVQAGGVLA